MRQIGELIHIRTHTDNIYVIVVMANELGIRYIDPNDIQFEDNGSVKTKYVTNDFLEKNSTSYGALGSTLVELS